MEEEMIHYHQKGGNQRLKNLNLAFSASFERWCRETLRRLQDSHRKRGRTVSPATVKFYDCGD